MRRVRDIAFVAAVLCHAGTAHASCDSANQFRFNFASQTARSLSYNSTYTYTATNGLGVSQNFSIALFQNGLSGTTVQGQALPAISSLVSGATTQNSLVVGGILSARTTTITSTTRVMRVTFNFPQPVRTVSLSLFDVDFVTNAFRDWVHVVGNDAGGNVYTPVMTSPAGNGNQTGQPVSAGASSVLFEQGGINARQATGNAISGNNSDTGTINVSFAQPVTSVVFSYGNAPLQSGETATGQQAVGISGVSYCPMPQIAVSKSSTPATGSLGAYNLPDNEVIYTLTVTNTGGSPVDAASLLLLDQLPTTLDFRNQPFDGTTTLPVKLTATGAVTLAASSLTYQQRGGTTYTYTPAAGFDPQVGALRIVPQGELGANASMTLQFRARIR